MLLSLGLTRLMMHVGIVDVPNERSSHVVSTPKSGGVAIIFPLFFFLVFADVFIAPVFSREMILMLALSGLLAGIGLLDDIFHLSYKPRLFVQLMVALTMVANGFSIDHIPLPGISEIPLGFMGPVITVFWVVGFINAFNFMDGLNGLASGGALVVSLLILYFMPIMNPMYFLFLGLIFSLFGYMRYNFFKGRIFMSDVGSQFLGGLFALATLMAEPMSVGLFRYYIIPLFFLPFIFDATLTFCLRLSQGKNVFQPHKEFLFHRLQAFGFTHAQVSTLYMILIGMQGCFVYFFLIRPSFEKLLINFLFYGMLALLVYKKCKAAKG